MVWHPFTRSSVRKVGSLNYDNPKRVKFLAAATARPDAGRQPGRRRGPPAVVDQLFINI